MADAGSEQAARPLPQPQEFETKARAYYEKILPNLPFRVEPEDAMEAIVDMIPGVHNGSDRRRLKETFKMTGTFTDLNHVMTECRKVCALAGSSSGASCPVRPSPPASSTAT